MKSLGLSSPIENRKQNQAESLEISPPLRYCAKKKEEEKGKGKGSATKREKLDKNMVLEKKTEGTRVRQICTRTSAAPKASNI
jgi:hypothetical protein